MPAIAPAKLRTARQRAGLSREYVALTLSRSCATIQAYEAGQCIPPGNVLVALAALYGVTVEDLCHEVPAGAW
jgi:transcriptional regulator with XRE-family HTH domain